MNLTANITAAIHVANQLSNSNERRELVHAVEYAQSSPSEHSRQRLIRAVDAARAKFFLFA